MLSTLSILSNASMLSAHSMLANYHSNYSTHSILAVPSIKPNAKSGTLHRIRYRRRRATAKFQRLAIVEINWRTLER